MEDETAQRKKISQHNQRRPSVVEEGVTGSANGRRRESPGGASDGGKRKEPKLVPLERIPAAREMMLAVLNSPRAKVRAMSRRLRKDYPGRTPGDVDDALRGIRDDRGERKGKHATLSEEEINILRMGYAGGPAEARVARKQLLKQRPDLNRHQVDRIVRELGLSTWRAPTERWSQKDHGFLMSWCEEKDVKEFVKSLGRTDAAIRARLSRYGASARLRMRRGYTVREAAALLGVSRTAISKWIAEGQLEVDPERNVRAISEAALRAFCKRHPDKVDRRLCSQKVLLWLPKARSTRPFGGRRGHLAHRYTCEKCGRRIRGNGYSNHVKVCELESESSGSNV